MNIQQVFSIIYHLFTYDWAHLYIIKSQMFSFLKASTLSWNLFQIRIPLNFGLRKMMENPQEQEVNCLKKKVNCLFKTGRRNKPVTLWTGSLIDPNSCWDPKTCWSQNLLIPKLVAAMSENNVDKHMFLKDSFFYFSFFNWLIVAVPCYISCVLCAKLLKLCPTLCSSVDCSLPVSSVNEILQARILEWVAISSSRGSSRPRDRTWVSCVYCMGRQILYCWAIGLGRHKHLVHGRFLGN